MPDAGNNKRLFAYGNILLACTFLILLVSTGVTAAFGVFFKPVLAEFGWTKAMISGAFSLSWLLCGLLGIVMGRLNDRYGSRGVFTFCGVLLGLGHLLMSQISSVWHIYLFYGVIIGTGMSGMWVPAMSTIARWFIVKRNTATAIVAVGGGVGALIAPPLANWLIARYDWRTSFAILGIVLLVVIVAAAQFMRRAPAPTGEIAGNAHIHDKPKVNSGATGSLSLKQAAYTVQFWLLFGMLFFFGFGAYLIQVHITPYAIELGIPSASAANMLATIGGLTVAGRFVLGGAAERVGNRRILAFGFTLMVASLLWLLPARSEWSLYLFTAVFGFSLGSAVVNPPLVAELFGLSSHGLILGINVLAYSIGCALGPFAGGYIFDVTGSYQVAFLSCVVAAVMGFILTVCLTPIRGRNK